MNKKNISIISTLVNIVLACLKLLVGFSIKSAALIADGIHSGMDIISSAVTYIGIKEAEKPADKEHPYGHYRSETIAGFVVIFLLFLSAVWIIYEGITGIIKNEPHTISGIALLIVVISIITNEAMARTKFKIGKREDSLALIADAEHSHADSLSSIAVLIGLSLVHWFPQADGVTAILVGFYILYETMGIGREVVDNLLDVSNPQIEKRIKEICLKEEIELLEIKTRRIGAKNFSELKIGLNKEWKMKRVSEVIKNLENILLKRIDNLSFITIQVVSHNFKEGSIKSKSGQITRFKQLPPKIFLEKKGERTIISYENGKLYGDFGAPEYLVIDRDKQGKIVQRKIIKNPYFTAGVGHGVRFIKSIKANKVITPEIGERAKKKLREMGVAVEIKNNINSEDRS
jgi:cation diffusion facilitator family transporter